ncbi:serine hydrolase domain-containing protein [Streptosporangium canum]|uniref:serine hydrolase domain-containing protein n=1 Tax=Streptosporangium canum TaxID=324952 RepID=UPI00344A40C5
MTHLAGYLVELRSGLPFHRYVQENILRPLGMTHTTMAQPEPEPVSRALAPGYRLLNGRQVRAEGAKYGHMPPHGAGFRSTATDMAAFMRARLSGGSPILEPESVRLMQGRRFANAEGTSGMGYGFQEYTRNGLRLVVHRGNIPGYFAVMALIPERGLGLYASYNGSGKGGPDSAWDLVNAFADRFAPSSPPAAGASGTLPDVAGFVGTYRSAQASDTADLGKLSAFMSAVTVTAGQDGILTTTGAVALVTASAASLVAMFADFEGNQADFFLGGSPMFSAIRTLPALAALATAASLAVTVLAWLRGWWGWAGRIHHTAVLLAAGAYLSVALSYNLLG